MTAATDRRMDMSLGWSSLAIAQGSFRRVVRRGRNPRRTPSVVGVASVALLALGLGVITSCGGDTATGLPASKGPAPLARISFSRSVDSVEIQRTSSVGATFFDSTGSVVDAGSTAWSTADTTIATVSAAGVVTGVHTGSTTLTLNANNSVTATLPVVVLPAAVATLTYATTSYTMIEGDTLTIPAPKIVDRTGAVVTGRAPAYSTRAANLSVTSSGFVTALTQGTATVTATLDTAHAQITFTVQQAPIGHVNVVPSVLDLGVGVTIATQSSATGLKGQALPGRPYTYRIDNTSVATVSSTGVVAGRGAGTATLTVATGSGSVNVPISVKQIAPGGFKIDVRFVGKVSPTVQSAALAAAARWEQVISAPLIPYHIVTRANDCGAGIPAVDTTETSLLVIVQVDSIDGRGKTAGLGGPCVIRDAAPQFTALGTVTVDSADVASLAQDGVLVALLTHEMGHILGIGTLWSDGTVRDSTVFFPNTAAGLGGPDPVFLGAGARAAYAQLGFTVDSARGVPIENLGTVGDGTRDGHWRASVFGHELMTGTLNNGPNPLSRITIEALGDFGYTVVPEAGDDFSVMNAQNPGGPVRPSLSLNPPMRGSATTSVPIQEIILYPRFTTTRDGVKRRITNRNQPATPQ
ncbi:MAG: leishmanolysin-related zinc metalloendopeptidase [Gemmatimonadaceae bacterium]